MRTIQRAHAFRRSSVYSGQDCLSITPTTSRPSLSPNFKTPTNSAGDKSVKKSTPTPKRSKSKSPYKNAAKSLNKSFKINHPKITVDNCGTLLSVPARHSKKAAGPGKPNRSRSETLSNWNLIGVSQGEL